MQHTLSREEYKEILFVEHLNHKKFDDDYKHVQQFIEDAKNWDRKLSGLNHLLSIIIEQFQKKGIKIDGVIDFVYSLNSNCDFEVQEGDLQFLESLFKNDWSSDNELEEELIIAQNRIYRDR